MKLLKKSDEEKFTKLHIDTTSSLACIAPSSYEDYRIHTTVQDFPQLLDITIESVMSTFKVLNVRMYCHNLGFTLEAIYFRPKPYMQRQFIKDERFYYFGKVEYSQGHAQVSHPKKVTQIGLLTPQYKSVLRADVMRRVMHNYITSEALTEEGLPLEVVNTLQKIHHPESELLYHDGNYNQEALYALKYTELYDYMKRLHSKRRYFNAIDTLKSEYKVWAKTLPFTLTDEQVKTIDEISEDFKAKNAAKRMIVGDVGSGKTMVILASVIMAQKSKFCSILMAPTTILANQIFEEAQKFLPNVKTLLVTNKTKKSIDLSEYDFLVGTHALLYRELPKSSLVMVDEQHRFGTAQRNLLEKLVLGEDSKTAEDKSIIARPHYLQFSATPIPRTQAMMDSAHIDVSLITTTPFEKDIDTSVIHREDFSELLEHIKSEIEQKHQVLFIYPLVEQSDALNYQSIEEARSYWEKNFNNVYVTHGKDKKKEEVLLKFREEGDILIATTVVEVGISLPNLTTIVIVGAERLGLSSLHQLRGRVSRNGLKGYCYLFTNQKKSQRLDEFCNTDNGFDIAQLDLKFRKSGDLLTGKVQSGKKFTWIDMAEDSHIVSQVKKDLQL